MYQRDNTWEGFQWLNVDDAQRSSIAYLRAGGKDTVSVVCVMNFTPVEYESFVFGLPGKGSLKEILNSDDLRFGGSGSGNPRMVYAKKQQFQQFPYSAEIRLPALSAVFFDFRSAAEHHSKGSCKST